MRCKKRSRRRGFTLVELMVVIVLVGLLATVVTVSVRSYLISGKQGVARLEIAKITQAVDAFYTQFGRYPTNEEGIAVLAQPSDSFPDGLLNKLPRDPWNHDYEYIYPGLNGPYDVVCYGADGREGGTGENKDITNADDGPGSN